MESLNSKVLSEEWIKTHPDCIQTGMYAGGALIPKEAQLSGLESHKNLVIVSRKTVRTVLDENESGANVRTSHALAVGVNQNNHFQIGINPIFFPFIISSAS